MADGAPTGRLEQLWAGEFGDDYVERNADAEHGRDGFWTDVVGRLQPKTALEVGCNVGGNLRWLAEMLGAEHVAGVDVNERALTTLRGRLPGVDARKAVARSLPFEDASFDLVFTMGVLIHQPTEELAEVMGEIVRCSRRWVLCGEYYDESEVEVAYHGERGALFRRDYGALYTDAFPELRLAATGFLGRGGDSSWDDVTWWAFEKSAS